MTRLQYRSASFHIYKYHGISPTMGKNEYYPVIVDVGSRYIRVGLAGGSVPITTEVKVTIASPQLRRTYAPATESTEASYLLPPWFELSDVEPEDKWKFQKQLDIHYPLWKVVSEQYHADKVHWDIWHSKQAMVFCLQSALTKLALPLKWMKVIMVSSEHKSNVRILWLADILLHSIQVKSVVLYPEPLVQCILSNTYDGLIFDFQWLETSITGILDLRQVCFELLERKFCGSALHYAVLDELLALGNPELTKIITSDTSFQVIERFIIKGAYVRSRHDVANKNNTDKTYNITETIAIPERLRYEVIEKLYFDGSIQQLASKLVRKTPIDNRKTLQDNVIITGGVAQIPGFKSRLIEELQLMLPKVQTRICLGSWTGVSLYLSMLLTRNSWEVLKPREINREELDNLVLANHYKIAKLDQYLFN